MCQWGVHSSCEQKKKQKQKQKEQSGRLEFNVYSTRCVSDGVQEGK